MQKEKEARKEEEMNMEGGGNKEESQSQNLPPGFRFHPSDEELITYYLINKMSDSSFTARAMADVDLNKCEPWELPGKAKMGEKEWYFFSLRDRKYPTGMRTNRATNSGYWKTTGKDKEIMMTRSSKSNSSVTCSSSSAMVVGMKKTLVFYKGRAPRGEKTNWVMHEYRMHSKSSFIRSSISSSKQLDEWVVCRVFQKSAAPLKKYPPSRSSAALLNNIIHPYYSLDIAAAAAAGVGGINNLMPHPQAPPLFNMNTMQLGVGGGDINNNIAVAPPPLFVYANNTSSMPMMSTYNNNNNPLMHSHFDFPVTTAGAFTISGLNLNLGGGGGGGASITQNDVVTSNIITPAVTNSLGGGDQYNATEISNLNLIPQTHSHTNIDHCVDLDTYWPSF